MENKRSVLVIEDFTAVRESLCSILESDGFEVIGCEDGVSALAAASEKHFHIIITDYRMPNISGIDVTKRLRRRFPVSLIIGVSSDDMTTDFLMAGADAFILKPYQYRELQKIIRPKRQ